MSASVAPLPESPPRLPETQPEHHVPAPRPPSSPPVGVLRRRRSVTAWCEQHVELSPNSGRADAYLDGLRGVAVLAVVLVHAFVLTGWPHVPLLGSLVDHLVLELNWAVPLFFELSAFLLVQPFLLAQLDRRPPPRTGRFLARRVTRLVPAYYLSLAAITLLLVPLDLLDPGELTSRHGLQNLGLHLVFLQHVLPQSSIHFAGADGPYWTLTMEALFYVSLPLFVRLFRGKGAWRTPLAMLAVVLIWDILSLHGFDGLVASMEHSVRGAAADGLHVPQGGAGMRMLLTTEYPAWLFCFSLGILVARLVIAHNRNGARQRARASRVAPWVLLTGIGLVVIGSERAGALAGEGRTGLLEVFLLPVLVQLGLALVILGLAVGPRTLRRPLETLPLRFVGWTSYGIYLSHFPLMIMLVSLTGAFAAFTLGSALGLFACALLLSLCVASVSWMLVERPAILTTRDWMARRDGAGRPGRRHRWRAVALGVAMVLLPAFLIGNLAVRRGPAQAYDGPLGAIRNVAMDPGATGRATLASALQAGFLGAEEESVLARCGATEGFTEAVGTSRWNGKATVFTCSDAGAAQAALAALPTVDAVHGYVRLDSGPHALLLHARQGQPGAMPFGLTARYRSGARVVSISLDSRSMAARDEAVRRVVEPALNRFRPSF